MLRTWNKLCNYTEEGKAYALKKTIFLAQSLLLSPKACRTPRDFSLLLNSQENKKLPTHFQRPTEPFTSVASCLTLVVLFSSPTGPGTLLCFPDTLFWGGFSRDLNNTWNIYYATIFYRVTGLKMLCDSVGVRALVRNRLQRAWESHFRPESPYYYLCS